MNNRTIKHLILLAMFVSIGILLQIVESRLNVIPTIPGGKLGLANIMTLASVNILGPYSALAVSVVRAVLGCILYGGLPALPYSLSGAVLSALTMILSIRKLSSEFTVIGVGVIGAVSHNVAQISVAYLIFGSGYIFTYLPILVIIAVISGTFTGYCGKLLNKRSVSWTTEK